MKRKCRKSCPLYTGATIHKITKHHHLKKYFKNLKVIFFFFYIILRYRFDPTVTLTKATNKIERYCNKCPKLLNVQKIKKISIAFN